jgi:oligosaccharide repeat unit polymerase
MNQHGPLLDLPKPYRFFAIVLILLYCALVAVAARHQDILTTVGVVIWVLTVAYPIIAYRRELGIENPLVITCILSLVTFPIRQTGLLINGLREHIALPNFTRVQFEELFFFGLMLQSLSLWMTYAGFRFARNVKGIRIVDLGKSKSDILLLIIAFVVVSLLGFLVVVLISGDMSAHLLNIAKGTAARRNAIDINAGGPLSILVGLIGAAGIISITSKQNPIVVVGTCSLALIILFLTDGRRSSVVYPLILFVITYSITHRKIPALSTIMVGVLAVIGLGFASSFREANWGQKGSLSLEFFRRVSIERAFEKAVEEFTARSGTSSPLYPIIARVPSDVDHLYGSGYVKWFNLFIPRLIWKDKPRGIDVDTGVTFFNATWGMPPGDIGQAYWEFNIPGVIVVFFLLGVAYRYFYNSLKGGEVTYASLAVYLVGVFYLGADQNSFRLMVVFFVPMVLVFVFLKYFRIRFARG